LLFLLIKNDSMKKYTFKVIATFSFVAMMVLGTDVFAGPPGGGGGPGDDDGCVPPPCVPIDGGISLLVAAGVALGGKKIFDSLKN
jgi:hypothetical protein